MDARGQRPGSSGMSRINIALAAITPTCVAAVLIISTNLHRLPSIWEMFR